MVPLDFMVTGSWVSHFQGSDVGGGAGFSKSVWNPEVLRIKVSDHCFLGVRGFKMEAKGHSVKAYQEL